MCRSWLSLGLLVTVQSLAQPVAEPAAAVRIEFQEAIERVREGDTDGTLDSESLRGYAIYPYLEAARLARDVADADAGWSLEDNAIVAFLARHNELPVTWNLRVAWLTSLGSRALWEPFQAYFRDDVADTALRCRHLSSRIALDQLDGLNESILGEWLTPFQLPLECEPVFQWLRDAGPLDDEQTAARVRLLLANGQAAFARIIAGQLPEARARQFLNWSDLIEYPLTTIEAHIAEPLVEVDSAMLLDGWSRLARDNPEAALNLYSDLIAAEGIGPTSPYTLALALGLAWDRRREALELFASVAEADIDDYALAWQARAALWAADWTVAREAIAKMSAEQRATAQWRYWAARTSDEREVRERLYASLQPRDNYFSAAAAAEQHDRPVTHHDPLPLDAGAVSQLATLPAVQRALELRQVDLPVAAGREWRHAYGSLGHDARRQSVHLAAGIGWYDLAIVTATELGIFFDYSLLYPTPYRAEVEAAADEFDLDPSLIYAVMRQESLYRPDAVSEAGALGLMQVQRGTARDVARDIGEPSPASVDPLDPPTNIRLGAARLTAMLERYDGHIVPALAAYNAGPAAADRWLPDSAIDGDVWLENIPYNETREYVRRVLWNTVVFEWLEDDQVNARTWLREVEPRSNER
jgi:soluble lytic murein transglycosylase